MTTDLHTQLLARIDEINKGLSDHCDCDRETVWICPICRYADPLFNALKGVAEMENPPDIGTVTGIEDAINHGRNLMIADVKQKIAEQLGVSDE